MQSLTNQGRIVFRHRWRGFERSRQTSSNFWSDWNEPEYSERLWFGYAGDKTWIGRLV